MIDLDLDILDISGLSAIQYRPLIDYGKWSLITIAGLRYVFDSGSVPKFNAASNACQGLWFDGTSQEVSVTYSTATHVSYFNHTTKVYEQETLAGSPFVFNPDAGSYSDLFFTRELTTAELTYLSDYPEVARTIALGGTDSGISLVKADIEKFFPMNDINAGTATIIYDIIDQTWATTATITNPQGTRWTNAANLQTGLQDIKFVQDATGRITTTTIYTEFNDSSYADTGWIPPNDSDWTIKMVYYHNLTQIGYCGREGGGTASIIFIGSYGDGSIYTRIGTATHKRFTATEGLHHVVMAFKQAGTYDVYIDKVLAEADIAHAYDPVTSHPFFIGANNAAGTPNRHMSNPIRAFEDHLGAWSQADVTADYDKDVAKGLLS